MSKRVAEISAATAVRPAADCDVPAIAAVWYDGWMTAHVGHVPEALIRYRTRGSFERRAGERLDDSLVAVADGRVVGFLRVHDAEIEQVFVEARCRGTGLAARLMVAGEAVLRRRGLVEAFLVVNSANERAQRFYLKQGWRSVGLVDYAAEIEDGTMVISILRYEKTLTHSHEEF